MPEEPATPSSSGSPQPAGASVGPVVLTGEPVSVALTLPEDARATLAEAAGARARRLLLSVEDIQAEQDPGLAYAVYLEAPGGRREHVGNVSLFGGPAIQAGAAGPRHVFDATDAVNALRAQGSFDPGSVSVTFEPIRVLPPPGQELPATAQATAPVPPVRVGRVGLYLA